MESESQVVGELPVLRTPVDWHPWIGLIRKITVMEGVWVYMDPDLEEQPKVPKRRSYKLPTPCSVFDGKAKHPSELTVWQKWGTLSASFGNLTAMSSAPAKGVRTRLVNLSTSIRRSVHKRYQANTPHGRCSMLSSARSNQVTGTSRKWPSVGIVKSNLVASEPRTDQLQS